jgi:hypothetical protein
MAKAMSASFIVLLLADEEARRCKQVLIATKTSADKEPVMTTFKELRSILNEIESLSARCKAAGLCLRSLLEGDDKPKQSTVRDTDDFPGVVDGKHRPYRWTAAQKAWIIKSHKSGKSVVWIANKARVTRNTVVALLQAEKVWTPRQRSSNRTSVSDVVLELIKTHAARGKIARTDLRRAAAKQRLSPPQVGQALRILDDAKKVTVDGDLITVQ